MLQGLDVNREQFMTKLNEQQQTAARVFTAYQKIRCDERLNFIANCLENELEFLSKYIDDNTAAGKKSSFACADVRLLLAALDCVKQCALY